MTCPHCIKALQLVVHQHYTEGCMTCGVRKVAYMPHEERERFYDRVQHISGIGDRKEAIRLVTEERARIASLKESRHG